MRLFEREGARQLSEGAVRPSGPSPRSSPVALPTPVSGRRARECSAAPPPARTAAAGGVWWDTGGMGYRRYGIQAVGERRAHGSARLSASSPLHGGFSDLPVSPGARWTRRLGRRIPRAQARGLHLAVCANIRSSAFYLALAFLAGEYLAHAH